MLMLDLIKIPRIMLSFVAIYHTREISTVYRFRRMFSILIIFVLFLCLFYHTALQVGDLVRLSMSLTVLISCLNSLVKGLIFTYKRKDFLKCIDMLDSPSFLRYNGRYGPMLKPLKNIGIGSQIANLVVTNLALLSYIILPVFDSTKYLPLEFAHFNSGIFHYPFYLFEIIGMYIGAGTNLGLDLLSVGFIMISVTQLRKLNNNLVDMGENVINLPNYSEENSERLTMEYLKDCCVHYSDIEEFSTLMENCFSMIALSQMVTTCVSVCNTVMLLTTVPIMSAEAMSYIAYIFSMLGEVGMYCWFGNFVRDESLEVLTSCYFSSWYECSPRVRRYLFILMERAKRPIEVKALGLITLSLETLIAILKCTYSYFALLQDISE